MIGQHSVALPIPEDGSSELPEQHVIGWRILRVIFKTRPLEVLHRVRLAILKGLYELLAQGQAELGQPTVGVPVGKEAGTDVVSGLVEVSISRLGINGRIGRVEF